MFPWLGRWLKDRKLIVKNCEQNLKKIKELVDNLEETLNFEETRGLVDSFLIRKKNAEVYLSCAVYRNFEFEVFLKFTLFLGAYIIQSVLGKQA